jgi:hypothetical protein
MRSFLIGLLALGLLAGCSQAPVAPTARVAAQGTLKPRSAKTGLGNPYNVKVYSYNAASFGLEISYEDKAQYFGASYNTINAFVRVRTRSGGEQVFRSVTLHQPSGGTLWRGGSVALSAEGPSAVTTQGDIESVELAFFSDGKWDSNHGKNYTVRF